MVRPNGSIMLFSFAPRRALLKIVARSVNVAPDRRGSQHGPSHLAVGAGATHHRQMQEFTVRPQPDDPRLTRTVAGIDHEGRPINTAVVTERPLTLFLNAREIVTMMTIGDRPDLLAIGYLLNQNMLRAGDAITAVDYDDDIATVVVRTAVATNFEDKLRKKVQTSGCAQGTVFDD